jgi:outer membrane cobalamin receptor
MIASSSFKHGHVNIFTTLYADDVNLLGDNIDTTKKNTETLIDATKVTGLEVNAEKTKYVAVWSPDCRAKS